MQRAEGGFSQVNKWLQKHVWLAESDPERALEQAFLSVGAGYGVAFTKGSTRAVRCWL